MYPSTKHIHRVPNQILRKVIWLLLRLSFFKLQCGQFIVIIVILCKFWKDKDRRASWVNGPHSNDHLYWVKTTMTENLSPLASAAGHVEMSMSLIWRTFFFESLFSRLRVVMAKCFRAFFPKCASENRWRLLSFPPGHVMLFKKLFYAAQLVELVISVKQCGLKFRNINCNRTYPWPSQQHKHRERLEGGEFIMHTFVVA